MSLSVPGPGTRNTQRRHSPLGSPHRTKTHKQLRCELRIQGMWSGQGKKAAVATRTSSFLHARYVHTTSTHPLPFSTPPTRPSLVAQMVKNLPAMTETQVQSLCREDPLEKGMAVHCSILA